MTVIEFYFICIVGRIEHYMWELPIHWDQDGRLILYNLAMIVFSFCSLYFSLLRDIMTADECYLSYSNCQNFLSFSSIYYPIVLSAKN